VPITSGEYWAIKDRLATAIQVVGVRYAPHFSAIATLSPRLGAESLASGQPSSRPRCRSPRPRHNRHAETTLKHIGAAELCGP